MNQPDGTFFSVDVKDDRVVLTTTNPITEPMPMTPWTARQLADQLQRHADLIDVTKAESDD